MKYQFNIMNPKEVFEAFKYEQNYDDANNLIFKLYNDYVRKLGIICPPVNIYENMIKNFFPYAKNVLINNYTVKIEDHISYYEIKRV